MKTITFYQIGFDIRFLCGICGHSMTRSVLQAVKTLYSKIHVGCSHCHDIVFTITLSPQQPELTYVTQNTATKLTVSDFTCHERHF